MYLFPLICMQLRIYTYLLYSLYQGKGVYRYIGSGDTEGGAIGQLCTRQRLDSQDGPSSIEITILDTGEYNTIYNAYVRGLLYYTAEMLSRMYVECRV